MVWAVVGVLGWGDDGSFYEKVTSLSHPTHLHVTCTDTLFPFTIPPTHIQLVKYKNRRRMSPMPAVYRKEYMVQFPTEILQQVFDHVSFSDLRHLPTLSKGTSHPFIINWLDSQPRIR
jgi:hypothetical protein